MCYKARTMISPGGVYVNVTMQRSENGVHEADDTGADDSSVTLSLSNDVSEKGKEDLGLIMARHSSADVTTSRRHSFPSQHDDIHDHVVMDSCSAICQEDILDKMDAMQTKYLTIPDDTEVDTSALSDFLYRLALFEPRYLTEVVFMVQNENRKLDIETQCQEIFSIAMEELHERREVSVTTAKEEFVPLLTKPEDRDDITEVKLTVSEHIFSGFRKLAQIVMDTLISVKTEDEDEQPYGEAT